MRLILIWFLAVEANRVQGWVMYIWSDNQINAHSYADRETYWPWPLAEICLVVSCRWGSRHQLRTGFTLVSLKTYWNVGVIYFSLSKGRAWWCPTLWRSYSWAELRAQVGWFFLLQYNWHLRYANRCGCSIGCKCHCVLSPISFNVLDRWFHQQH